VQGEARDLDVFIVIYSFFLGRFRDPIQVPRISNQVPRITENYHRLPTIRENWVTRIREIGSLQIHIGYLTFSLKKTVIYVISHHRFSLNKACTAPLHFQARSNFLSLTELLY